MKTSTTGIIIQARMSSSRLPGKSLAKIGPYPLVYYVVNRMKLLGIPVVVATSSSSSDDVLVDYLQQENIAYFRGRLNNVLQRYIAAAEEFGFSEIIRITADNPLVDIVALEQALPVFYRYDYVDAIYPNGWIKGTGFEWVRLKELRAINSLKQAHKEHVTIALREKNAENDRFLQLPKPSYQKQVKELVLTCDYPQDLELLQHIFEYFGYSYAVEIPKILEFYKENSTIFKKSTNLHL